MERPRSTDVADSDITLGQYVAPMKSVRAIVRYPAVSEWTRYMSRDVERVVFDGLRIRGHVILVRAAIYDSITGFFVHGA
jgi:hypothetical protein